MATMRPRFWEPREASSRSLEFGSTSSILVVWALDNKIPPDVFFQKIYAILMQFQQIQISTDFNRCFMQFCFSFSHSHSEFSCAAHNSLSFQLSALLTSRTSSRHCCMKVTFVWPRTYRKLIIVTAMMMFAFTWLDVMMWPGESGEMVSFSMFQLSTLFVFDLRVSLKTNCFHT